MLAQTGESAVYCDRGVLNLPVPAPDIDYAGDLQPVIDQWTRLYAATEDVHDQARFEREVVATHRLQTRGIEVGQIFYFGTKYSLPMKAAVTGADGVARPIHGGCYGVGISRLIGAIIEASHDEQGLVWPASVAPFDVGLVNLKSGDTGSDDACETLYAQLRAAGLSVLYDDTDDRAGAKFSKMDLIGLPWQLIVGPRGLDAGVIELKHRVNGERQGLSIEAAVPWLTAAHANLTANYSGEKTHD